MEETISIAQKNRSRKQQLWREMFNNKEKLTQKIYEESSDIWINVHDIMHVISNESNDDVISFIFASQQTNFRHLYHVQTKLGEAQRETHDQCLAIPLTSGPWEVLGRFPHLSTDYLFRSWKNFRLLMHSCLFSPVRSMNISNFSKTVYNFYKI